MKAELNRRMPAYPLFVKDPYFSVWLDGDSLTEAHTVFWHGEYKPMCGKVSIFSSLRIRNAAFIDLAFGECNPI